MGDEERRGKKRGNPKLEPVPRKDAQPSSQRIRRAMLIGVTLGAVVVMGATVAVQFRKKPLEQATRANTNVDDVAKPEVLEGKAAPYHITVTNPAAWKRLPSATDNDMALEHRATGSALVIGVGPLTSSFLTADDIADTSLEMIKAIYPSFRVLSREPINDAGSAILIRATSSKYAGGTDHLFAYFVQDDSFYFVEGVAPTRQFAQIQAEMEAIIRSFTPPPPIPAQTTLPTPVLGMAAPAAPSARFGELDLEKADTMQIAALAHEAHGKHIYEAAAQLWHWAVIRGYSQGMYNLACAFSRLEQKDAAFYWLERAAAEDGVDPKWAEDDADLEVLRNDARWTAIRPYLLQASRYWQQSGLKETLLVVPKGYKRGAPIPVVVGLHGFGSVPKDFAGEQLQRIADANSIAFVGVSGTIPAGPHSYRWVESPRRDAKRIDDALAEVANRVTASPGQVILIGFSQGAQMAAEIAARHPDRYAGAIVMSPGTFRNMGLGSVERIAEIEKRRFVVVVGAGESPGNVMRAKQDAERLRALGAEVMHKEYESQQAHSFPADYEKALPEWIRFILENRPSGKAP